MDFEPSTWFGNKKWDVPTGGFSAAIAIGLSFIFLAYVLDPFVVSAYNKVRAYRAWRAIENGERVEVTSYSMSTELLRGRGKWDAARIITLLLAVFYFTSWVLELSLDIHHIDLKAEFLTQPPPIFLEGNDALSSPWLVLNRSVVYGESTEEWYDLPRVNQRAGQAISRYKVFGLRKSIFHKANKQESSTINGNIVVAKWYLEDGLADSFSYGSSNSVIVESVHQCSEGVISDTSIKVVNEDDSRERWGSVLHCGEGPQKVDGGNASAQPAIILTKDGEEDGTGDTHVIVEESAQYPSFLYSVWNASGSTVNAANETGSGVELKYAFHVASTARLAEAVVTGIVNGEDTGGGCFGLLRKYSEDYASNSTQDGKRASPFGEKPSMNEFVDNLEEVEAIEHGIKIGVNGVVCFSLLGVLSSIGVLWSFVMNSRIGMDIFDRDQLLRAVSVNAQGLPDDPEEKSTMRIYVQKEDGGSINVIISEYDVELGCCLRFLLRRGPTASDYPVPAANREDDRRGAPRPPPSVPQFELRSVRTDFGTQIGRGRMFPGRPGRYPYPSSSIEPGPSPVPSNAGSRVATPISARIGGTAVAGTPATPYAIPNRSYRLGAAPIPPQEGTPARSTAGSKAATPTAGCRPSPTTQGGPMGLGAFMPWSNPGSRTSSPSWSNAGSSTGTPVVYGPSRRLRQNPIAEGGVEGDGPNSLPDMRRGPSIYFDDSDSSSEHNPGENELREPRRDIEEERMVSSPARRRVPPSRGGYPGESTSQFPNSRRSSPVPPREVTANSTHGHQPQIDALTRRGGEYYSTNGR